MPVAQRRGSPGGRFLNLPGMGVGGKNDDFDGGIGFQFGGMIKELFQGRRKGGSARRRYGDNKDKPQDYYKSKDYFLDSRHNHSLK